MNSTKPQTLDADKKAQELIDLYNSMIGAFTSPAFLIMGLPGTGKTKLTTTGRLPILIDMFDPKGMILFETHPELKEMRKNGSIIIRYFGNENSERPSEYLKWEKQFLQDCQSGFLSYFGSYVTDTGNNMIRAMSNQIVKTKGGKRLETRNLEIQDYIPLYNTVKDIIAAVCSQGCDYFYLAHTYEFKNELTGDIHVDIDTYERLRTQIKGCFSEKYHITRRKKPTGVEYQLLTTSAGLYEASTQLHGLDPIEEPNIKKLFEKAGLSTKDKPLFKLRKQV